MWEDKGSMKKEKLVSVAPTRATTRKVTKFYCDIPDCGDEAAMLYGGVNSAKCNICKRDVCKRHLEYDPDNSGDYPEKWCSICYPLILYPRREMEERHDKEADELLEKVKKESLK